MSFARGVTVIGLVLALVGSTGVPASSTAGARSPDRACSTAPPPTRVTGHGWSLAHYDYHHTFSGIAATPSGSLWAVGRFWPNPCGNATDKPLVLRGDGRGGWTRVTAPKINASLVAATSDRDVWLFGDSSYARWNGSAWTVKAWKGKRITAAYAKGKTVWIIENANVLSGAGGAEEPWRATGVLRHWDGAAWRVDRTPLTVKGIADGWLAGSARGKAALARRPGGAWQAVVLPAVPKLHKGQISELTDVAVSSTGVVTAVGWVAWVCGVEEEDVRYCGRALTLRGTPGHWAFSTRTSPVFRSYVEIEADANGGVWIVYEKNEFEHGYIRLAGTKWTFGDFPAGPLGNSRIGHLVLNPKTHTLWAAGTDATEMTGPPYRGGPIWRWAP